jgi:hypothetical protein
MTINRNLSLLAPNIDAFGILKTTGYILPTASTSTLGAVKVDGSTITINNGVISGSSNYSLPTASTTTLGGIKIGSGLSIDENGVVTASGGSLTASGVTAGTYTNATVTVNTNGLVTAASNGMDPMTTAFIFGG